MKHKTSVILIKAIRIICVSAASVVAAVCVLSACAVWYLNSRNLAPMLEEWAAPHIEGKLKVGNISLSLRHGILGIGIEADSIAVVSDAFKSLSASERGLLPEYSDSLITLDHLSGSLDLKKLIFKNELSLHDVALHGLSVNVVIARNGKSNYNILKIKRNPTDRDKGKSPAFSIDRFSLNQPREIRFFNAADSTAASVLLLTEASVDGHDQPNYRLKINGNVTSPKMTILTNLEQMEFGLNGKLFWDSSQPGLVAMDKVELRGAFMKAILTGEIDFDTDPIIRKASVELMPLRVSDLLTLLPDSVRRHHKLFYPDFMTDAAVRGRFVLTSPMNLTTDTFPSSQIEISMGPSMLRHGKSQLQNIVFDATVNTVANKPDRTVVEVSRLSAEGSGTDFRASAIISNPISDPSFDLQAKGLIDLDDLPRVVLEALPGFFSGKISADLHAAGKLSMMKTGKFNDIAGNGRLSLNDIYFISADTTRMVQIGKAVIDMTNESKQTAKPNLNANLKVDTATLLVSGIDIAFSNLTLQAEGNDPSARLKVGRLNVTTLKDSAGARCRDIAGVIRMKGKFGHDGKPQLTADITARQVSAGTATDRIVIGDASIHSWMAKMTDMAKNVVKVKQHKISPTRHEYTYIPPSEVRKYVVKKRSMGKHIKRVYAEVDADNEELLIWNLNEHFRKFINEWRIKGTVKSHSGRLLSPLFPLRNSFSDIDIRFSNDTVDLEEISLQAGRSDITVAGLVTNVRRALTSDSNSNLKANLAIESRYMDINQLSAAVFAGASFRSDSRKGKKYAVNSKDDKSLASSIDEISKERAGKSAPVLIPVNVDASMKLRAHRLVYGDLQMTDVGGDVLVYDGGVVAHDINATSDAGSLSLTAMYSAPKVADMQMGIGLQAKDFNVEKFAILIPALDSITPLLHDFSGFLGADIAVAARLDKGMNLNLASLDAAVRISGDNLAFIDPEKYRILGKWLGFRNKSDNTIHRLNVEITVRDGILKVYPFAFDIDRYRLGAYGYNNLDMDFDYHISVLKSPLPFKFGITIKGNPKKYKIRFGGAKFNEDTAIESVSIFNNARINLIEEIQDVFLRGVRNSHFTRLRVPVLPENVTPSDSIICPTR